MKCKKCKKEVCWVHKNGECYDCYIMIDAKKELGIK